MKNSKINKLKILLSAIFIVFAFHPSATLAKKGNHSIDIPSSHRVTPFEQGESEVDLGISATIRRNVVGDDTLSFLAKNLNIVTRHQIVVLDGKVKTKDEMDKIQEYARTTKDVVKVINQMKLSK